jgi:hypothetical protein
MPKISTGEDIKFHPALVKLAADGYPDAVALSGFIGPSSNEGFITLYRDLRKLERGLEVRLSDIVHVEDIPESIVPFGAKRIWVRKDADLELRISSVRRVETTESAPGFVESSAGRLTMRRPVREKAADCTSWCQILCASHCEYSEHCDLTCSIPKLPGPAPE